MNKHAMRGLSTFETISKLRREVKKFGHFRQKLGGGIGEKHIFVAQNQFWTISGKKIKKIKN